jgi:hypothetical protein
MKNFDWEALLIPVLMIGSLFLIVILGFGTDAYGKYLDTYNTQKDREMFLKSYEIVLECRKSYGIGTRNPTISADEVCGELPVFVDAVK